jgi:hypothetical protein
MCSERRDDQGPPFSRGQHHEADNDDLRAGANRSRGRAAEALPADTFSRGRWRSGQFSTGRRTVGAGRNGLQGHSLRRRGAPRARPRTVRVCTPACPPSSRKCLPPGPALSITCYRLDGSEDCPLSPPVPDPADDRRQTGRTIGACRTAGRRTGPRTAAVEAVAVRLNNPHPGYSGPGSISDPFTSALYFRHHRG